MEGEIDDSEKIVVKSFIISKSDDLDEVLDMAELAGSVSITKYRTSPENDPFLIKTILMN
jgi:hypothetical protein